MPKFSVIEGDGPREPPDYHRQVAEMHLRASIVELLRALVRGEDNAARFLERWTAFSRTASETTAPAGVMINAVIYKMSVDIDASQEGTREAEMARIVSACLKLAAEKCTDDGFSGARTSTQERLVNSLIEDYVIAREARARQNGWSLLKKIEKDHFKKRPVRRPSKRSQAEAQAALQLLLQSRKKDKS